MNKQYSFLILFIFLFSSVCVANNEKNFIINDDIVITNSDGIKITPTIYKLGIVDTNEVYYFYFNIKNTSNTILQIDNVISSCSCSKVFWVNHPKALIPTKNVSNEIKLWESALPKDITVLPNDSVFLKVQFNTSGMKGKINRSIRIRSKQFPKGYKSMVYAAEISPIDLYDINIGNQNPIYVDNSDKKVIPASKLILRLLDTNVVLDSFFIYNTLGYNVNFDIRDGISYIKRNILRKTFISQQKQIGHNKRYLKFKIFEKPGQIERTIWESSKLNSRSSLYEVFNKGVYIYTADNTGPQFPPSNYVTFTFMAFIGGEKYLWSEEFKLLSK